VLPRRGRVLVCREPALAAPSVAASPGATVAWDGRFALRLPDDAPGGLTLGALGTERPAAARDIPPAALTTLPALRDEAGIAAVPHLGFWRAGAALDRRGTPGPFFRPARPLTRGSFTVV